MQRNGRGFSSQGHVSSSAGTTGSLWPTRVVQVFVLGIDPGLSRCGSGCIERGRPPRAVAAGVIRTDPRIDLPQRLAELQLEIRSLIADVRPDVVAVERVLFQQNVSTAMGVGMACGIVMAEAVVAGCDVAEYSPNEIKQAVAGHGSAGKHEVGQMVQTLLGLSKLLSPADAADAAAVALCHLAHIPGRSTRARISGVSA